MLGGGGHVSHPSVANRTSVVAPAICPCVTLGEVRSPGGVEAPVASDSLSPGESLPMVIGEVVRSVRGSWWPHRSAPRLARHRAPGATVHLCRRRRLGWVPRQR